MAYISRHLSPLHLFTMFLVHHLEGLGVSESTLRETLGVSEGWLRSLVRREFVRLVPRIVTVSQRLARDDLVFLHAGERFHFCLAGAGGLAATHAPTPNLALETFGRFVNDRELLSVTSSDTGGETVFSVEVKASWPAPVRHQIVDGYFSCLVAALRSVCGGGFSPIEVQLMRPQPGDTRSFSRALHADVTFGSTRNEAVVRTADLAAVSLLCEPLLYEQLSFIADLGADEPSGISPLRQLVEQAIRGGGDSVERVARTLQTTPRTLQRRLQKEGETFRGVLTQVRASRARELLVGSRLSVSAIAARLDYSDDKALRRAVKSVTGLTPTQIRDRARR